MGQRRREGRPLKRNIAKRQELRTIVMFSEGSNSEPDYINGLRRLPHIAEDATMNLELSPDQGVPLTLVQKAVERKRDPEVDECWCLFDVEWPKNHPNLHAAIDLARAHGIRLAISNPCFEIWLILHHRDFYGFVSTDEAGAKAVRSTSDQERASMPASTCHFERRQYVAPNYSQVAMNRTARSFPRTTHPRECTSF